jgi:hypothetical protein
MEPEGSLPCSQWPTTGPEPEPDASSPKLSTPFPSISEGRPLHPQPEDAPCRGDRDPHNMVFCLLY